ncbi:hypothetical protein CYMTET_14552 [Cymbomonas tetramitiformis]|uniref:Dilute domain-containing protein n=1 Tax=Cymbomonas tetramitiformis TaxID=36881 RepID=A0AAE0GG45_9CHLO|nr:hypothetical protein CYMTET_14552 [Cymbomonas tetramitiformis]
MANIDDGSSVHMKRRNNHAITALYGDLSLYDYDEKRIPELYIAPTQFGALTLLCEKGEQEIAQWRQAIANVDEDWGKRKERTQKEIDNTRANRDALKDSILRERQAAQDDVVAGVLALATDKAAATQATAIQIENLRTEAKRTFGKVVREAQDMVAALEPLVPDAERDNVSCQDSCSQFLALYRGLPSTVDDELAEMQTACDKGEKKLKKLQDQNRVLKEMELEANKAQEASRQAKLAAIQARKEKRAGLVRSPPAAAAVRRAPAHPPVPLTWDFLEDAPKAAATSKEAAQGLHVASEKEHSAASEDSDVDSDSGIDSDHQLRATTGAQPASREGAEEAAEDSSNGAAPATGPLCFAPQPRAPDWPIQRMQLLDGSLGEDCATILLPGAGHSKEFVQTTTAQKVPLAAAWLIDAIEHWGYLEIRPGSSMALDIICEELLLAGAAAHGDALALASHTALVCVLLSHIVHRRKPRTYHVGKLEEQLMYCLAACFLGWRKMLRARVLRHLGPLEDAEASNALHAAAAHDLWYEAQTVLVETMDITLRSAVPPSVVRMLLEELLTELSTSMFNALLIQVPACSTNLARKLLAGLKAVMGWVASTWSAEGWGPAPQHRVALLQQALNLMVTTHERGPERPVPSCELLTPAQMNRFRQLCSAEATASLYLDASLGGHVSPVQLQDSNALAQDTTYHIGDWKAPPSAEIIPGRDLPTFSFQR